MRLLCELAAERGLRVDMHCDESDDPQSRHIETLAFHTRRLGLQGRVTGSHLTSMHSMDNYYASKLIPLIAESGVHVVANPLINITLQGRHDSYPKRRGMTRVPELLAAGVGVGFGHDCVMDPWYALGSADMLEVAAMGLHVAQMTSACRGSGNASTPSPSTARASSGCRATASSPAAAPTSCCCRRARRRRRSVCGRSACWWCAAAAWSSRMAPATAELAAFPGAPTASRSKWISRDSPCRCRPRLLARIDSPRKRQPADKTNETDRFDSPAPTCARCAS